LKLAHCAHVLRPAAHNNRSYLFFDCCFNARAIGMEESLPRWREQLGGRMAARFVISVCSSAAPSLVVYLCGEHVTAEDDDHERRHRVAHGLFIISRPCWHRPSCADDARVP